MTGCINVARLLWFGSPQPFTKETMDLIVNFIPVTRRTILPGVTDVILHRYRFFLAAVTHPVVLLRAEDMARWVFGLFPATSAELRDHLIGERDQALVWQALMINATKRGIQFKPPRPTRPFPPWLVRPMVVAGTWSFLPEEWMLDVEADGMLATMDAIRHSLVDEFGTIEEDARRVFKDGLQEIEARRPDLFAATEDVGAFEKWRDVEINNLRARIGLSLGGEVRGEWPLRPYFLAVQYLLLGQSFTEIARSEQAQGNAASSENTVRKTINRIISGLCLNTPV